MKDWIVTFRTREVQPTCKRIAIRAGSLLEAAMKADADERLTAFEMIKIEVLE